jgi:hypothetical protein
VTILQSKVSQINQVVSPAVLRLERP